MVYLLELTAKNGKRVMFNVAHITSVCDDEILTLDGEQTQVKESYEEIVALLKRCSVEIVRTNR